MEKEPEQKPRDYDYTKAARANRMRQRGRQVSVVLQDERAIARWDDLLEIHGTQRLVLESLLDADERRTQEKS